MTGPGDAALAAVRAALPAGQALPDVLEVGCGDGAFAARVRAEIPQAAFVATDLSRRCVEAVTLRGLFAREADLQHLPFDDGSYDVVVGMSVLEHVSDPDRALAEVRRVLRAGGTFIAVTDGEEHADAVRRRFGTVTVEPLPARAVLLVAHR